MRFAILGGVAGCFLLAGATAVLAKSGADYTPDISNFKPLSPLAGDGNYKIAPPYADAPELTANPSVPKGKVYHFVMDSADSKIYPGISKRDPGHQVPYHRGVTVYVPSQYQPGTPSPFFVSQDSMGRDIFPTILDNMIAANRLPAMVGVMIDSGGDDAQGSERGLEYDTVSGRYAEFIQTEVLPRISHDYNVTFTNDPDGRMTMGGSSGAACAFSMAWWHPEWYHRVLSYSGTYVNQQWPFHAKTPHGAWEYHAHLIPESDRLPLRIWMEVGAHDIRYNDDESTYHNWVMANMRFADALKGKNYPYQYVFAADAGHVDGRVVRQTLPAAMEYLWKGYRPVRR